MSSPNHSVAEAPWPTAGSLDAMRAPTTTASKLRAEPRRFRRRENCASTSASSSFRACCWLASRASKSAASASRACPVRPSTPALAEPRRNALRSLDDRAARTSRALRAVPATTPTLVIQRARRASAARARISSSYFSCSTSRTACVTCCDVSFCSGDASLPCAAFCSFTTASLSCLGSVRFQVLAIVPRATPRACVERVKTKVRIRSARLVGPRPLALLDKLAAFDTIMTA